MKILKTIFRLIFIASWAIPIMFCFTILIIIFTPQMKWVDFKYVWQSITNWLLTGNRKGV